MPTHKHDHKCTSAVQITSPHHHNRGSLTSAADSMCVVSEIEEETGQDDRTEPICKSANFASESTRTVYRPDKLHKYDLNILVVHSQTESMRQKRESQGSELAEEITSIPHCYLHFILTGIYAAPYSVAYARLAVGWEAPGM
jgi:hypothetical protein